MSAARKAAAGKKAAAARKAASKKAVASRKAPSKKAVASRKAPSKKAVASKKAPSKKAVASRKAPSRKAAPKTVAARRSSAPPVVRVSTEGGPFVGASSAVVRRRAERMLAHLRLGGAELSVALVDDATIHALNKAWRKKDKPTDVLAFALGEGEGVRSEGGLLGDVILSVETARRQADERGRPLLAELTMLLAHGLLHLVGYDHRTDAEEAEMTAATRELEAAAVARGAATRP